MECRSVSRPERMGFRPVFHWGAQGPEDVEIVDYH
jgi:hypothetical protein